MTIQFEIPENLEERLRSTGMNPSQAAKELLFVNLYREAKLTHHELGEVLGLSRYEIDGVLKRHDIPFDLNIEELRAETAFLDEGGRR